MKKAAAWGVLLAFAAAPGLAVFSGGCSALATFDDRPSHDGGAAASKDGGAGEGDATDVDSGTDVGAYANGCPGHAGPEPVKADGFCIDSTEVTNAQYADFLADMKGKPGASSGACGFNTTFVPESGWPAESDKRDFPVVEIDWCDAQAFCSWSGKRLCGKIGGGPSDPEDQARSSSQWFVACSASGTRQFPYGNSYDEDACNGSDRNMKRPVPVASMARCQGGVEGLFDMSGNVLEWEDSCEGTGGASDPCLVRGGAFDSSQAKLSCGAPAVVDERAAAHGDVGFRCCGP